MEYLQYLDLKQLKADCIEPAEENFQIVLNYISQYVDQKISKEMAEAYIHQYLSNFDCINKFFSSYTPFQGMNVVYPEPFKIMHNRRKRSLAWTKEEDEKLLSAIEEHGNSNWGAVAAMVGNGRTKSQCSQRYNRVINPNISKANWSKEEEDKLLQIVAQVGNKSWTRVAAQFGNRTDVQCRFKYNYLVKKIQNSGQQPAAPPPQPANGQHNEMVAPFPMGS